MIYKKIFIFLLTFNVFVLSLSNNKVGVYEPITYIFNETKQIHLGYTEYKETTMNSKIEEPISDYGVIFMCTAYCGCIKCNGEFAGMSASGRTLYSNHSIAADLDVLPMSSHIYIEDLGEFVVDDVGGAIQNYHVDIYFDSHEEALDFGVQYKKIYILN